MMFTKLLTVVCLALSLGRTFIRAEDAVEEDDGVWSASGAETKDEDGLEAPDWSTMTYRPTRCVFDEDGTDWLEWTMYEDTNGMCMSYNYQMTLVTPIAEFLKAVVGEKEEASGSGGQEDSDVYACTLSADNTYYTMIGSSMSSTQAFDVLAFTDAACTLNAQTATSDQLMGNEVLPVFDDSCATCVGVDDNGDDVELCDELWDVSTYCDTTCQQIGVYVASRRWGPKSIAALLLELGAIFAFMFTIVGKQEKLGQSSLALLDEHFENRGVSRKGMVGIFAGFTLLIVALACASLVHATLLILFVLMLCLFLWLVKLSF